MNKNMYDRQLLQYFITKNDKIMIKFKDFEKEIENKKD
jgi:hypothetical protein